MANRHLVISRALALGYNAYLPIINQGVDFILHSEFMNRSFFVQLKSRWQIRRKYSDRAHLHYAFPGVTKDDWYLISIPQMTEIAEELGWLNTKSAETGEYSTPKPSKNLLRRAEKFKLEAVLSDRPPHPGGFAADPPPRGEGEEGRAS